MENNDLRSAQESAKKRRTGVTVRDLGTFTVSTHEALGQVVALEAVRAMKKGNGKRKAVQADSPGPSEHDPGFEIYGDGEFDV